MMNYIPIVDGVFKGRCKGSGSGYRDGEPIGIMKNKEQCLKKCMTDWRDANGCTYLAQGHFKLSKDSPTQDGSCFLNTDEVVEGNGLPNEICWKLVTKGVLSI